VRVAIDVSPLSRPRTGVGSYLLGMVAGLAALPADEGVEVVAFAPVSRRGARRIAETLAGVPLELRTWRVPYPHAWRTVWSRLGRPGAEWLLGPLDVLHFSDWMYPPQRAGVRATTVYDLVPLRFPEWVTPRTQRMHLAKLEHARRTCDVVFCDSAFTAQDVVERLELDPGRVQVAYPGIDPRYRPDGDPAGRPAPYVLAVSTLEPRKNVGVLVQAFRLLRRVRPELELVVAGAVGWGDQPGLDAPGVVALGFVGAEELARLYRGAAAFAYPSRFEGFGLPVVEAMASGVAAVVSSHPSLDEACGGAALRAGPDSSEELAEALERALAAPDDLRRRGLEHARSFTREACARAVLAGYRSAV